MVEVMKKRVGGLEAIDRLPRTVETVLEYGLTENIDTFNPLRIAYHEFVDIGRDVRSAHARRSKLGHVFHRPGWRPATRSAGLSPLAS